MPICGSKVYKGPCSLPYMYKSKKQISICACNSGSTNLLAIRLFSFYQIQGKTMQRKKNTQSEFDVIGKRLRYFIICHALYNKKKCIGCSKVRSRLSYDTEFCTSLAVYDIWTCKAIGIAV